MDAKFRDWLPKSAGYSVIILLSSIVETQLLAFAAKMGSRANCVFTPNDLNGSVLDRAKLYIKRVSGLDLNSKKHWKTLTDLQFLRNVIVHRAGRPGDDKGKRLEGMCSFYPGLSLDENRHALQSYVELNITLHSCRYFAGAVEQFFVSLFKDARLPVEIGLWPNIESGSP